MKVARACAPASARLSLQAMRLSYFKNSDFTSSLQRKHFGTHGLGSGSRPLNDGTYYVHINFNVRLNNNNLFHILNEHVHTFT